MFVPPKNILIKSDSNEIEHIRTVSNKSENMYVYKFIKSITKLGIEMVFTEKELIKNLKNTFEIKSYERE